MSQTPSPGLSLSAFALASTSRKLTSRESQPPPPPHDGHRADQEKQGFICVCLPPRWTADCCRAALQTTAPRSDAGPFGILSNYNGMYLIIQRDCLRRLSDLCSVGSSPR